MGSANPDLEPSPGDNPSPPPRPSSFHGRLQLQDFVYHSADAPTPRRSARHAAASAASPSPSSSALSTRAATPSPRKRARRSPSPSPSSSGVAKPKPKPKKKRAPSSGYAPPSVYAHLPLLPDAVCANLLVFFVGLNPGLQTARTGHAYAHPTNTFWKLLFSSGITPVPCTAAEDRQMPARYSLGHTNIVARPSRNGAELSRREMDEGVALLEQKARTWRPECMCVVGKSIWESIWRVRHAGRAVGKSFRYGWQDAAENMGVVEGEWEGARVFVASSTSGLAATLSPAQKQEIWNELGAWVKMRRAERELAAEREAASNA
ncbi:DNA glycosylase, G/T mismatch [Akanthomyces lecanii RCEF 1005]|uniref:DNA glycosylase, G/T mismatch n=1 Tax=Akanthomyces lecanii RCEF 1005 TaxID=1081108 RepID=A0A162KF86_CORDF|nr:DNA glycosylase, G/T mismatch [Akanthomyces lecanii RCEF 1005]